MREWKLVLYFEWDFTVLFVKTLCFVGIVLKKLPNFANKIFLFISTNKF